MAKDEKAPVNSEEANPPKQISRVSEEEHMRVHGYTNTPMPVRATGKAKAKALGGMGSVDVAIYKRLCNVISKRWDSINSKELTLLCGVVLYLQCNDKRTGNKDDILRWLGFRLTRAIKKQANWLETLCDKGFLLRVQYDAGAIDRRGHGFGLTEYGQACLDDLDKEYDKARQWVEDQHRKKDVILYLDKLKEQLHPRQRALLIPKQIEAINAIKLR